MFHRSLLHVAPRKYRSLSCCYRMKSHLKSTTIKNINDSKILSLKTKHAYTWNRIRYFSTESSNSKEDFMKQQLDSLAKNLPVEEFDQILKLIDEFNVEKIEVPKSVRHILFLKATKQRRFDLINLLLNKFEMDRTDTSVVIDKAYLPKYEAFYKAMQYPDLFEDAIKLWEDMISTYCHHPMDMDIINNKNIHESIPTTITTTTISTIIKDYITTNTTTPKTTTSTETNETIITPHYFISRYLNEVLRDTKRRPNLYSLYQFYYYLTKKFKINTNIFNILYLKIIVLNGITLDTLDQVLYMNLIQSIRCNIQLNIQEYCHNIQQDDTNISIELPKYSIKNKRSYNKKVDKDNINDTKNLSIDSILTQDTTTTTTTTTTNNNTNNNNDEGDIANDVIHEGNNHIHDDSSSGSGEELASVGFITNNEQNTITTTNNSSTSSSSTAATINTSETTATAAHTSDNHTTTATTTTATSTNTADDIYDDTYSLYNKKPTQILYDFIQQHSHKTIQTSYYIIAHPEYSRLKLRLLELQNILSVFGIYLQALCCVYESIYGFHPILINNNGLYMIKKSGIEVTNNADSTTKMNDNDPNSTSTSSTSHTNTMPDSHDIYKNMYINNTYENNIFPDSYQQQLYHHIQDIMNIIMTNIQKEIQYKVILNLYQYQAIKSFFIPIPESISEEYTNIYNDLHHIVTKEYNINISENTDNLWNISEYDSIQNFCQVTMDTLYDFSIDIKVLFPIYEYNYIISQLIKCILKQNNIASTTTTTTTTSIDNNTIDNTVISTVDQTMTSSSSLPLLYKRTTTTSHFPTIFIITQLSYMNNNYIIQPLSSYLQCMGKTGSAYNQIYILSQYMKYISYVKYCALLSYTQYDNQYDNNTFIQRLYNISIYNTIFPLYITHFYRTISKNMSHTKTIHQYPLYHQFNYLLYEINDYTLKNIKYKLCHDKTLFSNAYGMNINSIITKTNEDNTNNNNENNENKVKDKDINEEMTGVSSIKEDIDPMEVTVEKYNTQSLIQIMRYQNIEAINKYAKLLIQHSQSHNILLSNTFYISWMHTYMPRDLSLNLNDEHIYKSSYYMCYHYLYLFANIRHKSRQLNPGNMHSTNNEVDKQIIGNTDIHVTTTTTTTPIENHGKRWKFVENTDLPPSPSISFNHPTIKFLKIYTWEKLLLMSLHLLYHSIQIKATSSDGEKIDMKSIDNTNVTMEIPDKKKNTWSYLYPPLKATHFYTSLNSRYQHMFYIIYQDLNILKAFISLLFHIEHENIIELIYNSIQQYIILLYKYYPNNTITSNSSSTINNNVYDTKKVYISKKSYTTSDKNDTNNTMESTDLPRESKIYYENAYIMMNRLYFHIITVTSSQYCLNYISKLEDIDKTFGQPNIQYIQNNHHIYLRYLRMQMYFYAKIYDIHMTMKLFSQLRELSSINSKIFIKSIDYLWILYALSKNTGINNDIKDMIINTRQTIDSLLQQMKKDQIHMNHINLLYFLNIFLNAYRIDTVEKQVYHYTELNIFFETVISMTSEFQDDRHYIGHRTYRAKYIHTIYHQLGHIYGQMNPIYIKTYLTQLYQLSIKYNFFDIKNSYLNYMHTFAKTFPTQLSSLIIVIDFILQHITKQQILNKQYINKLLKCYTMGKYTDENILNFLELYYHTYTTNHPHPQLLYRLLQVYIEKKEIIYANRLIYIIFQIILPYVNEDVETYHNILNEEAFKKLYEKHNVIYGV